MRVLERLPTGGLNGISTLNYLDWTNQNAVFEYMAAEAGWRATLTGGDEPVSIRGARVSAHYFDIFGAKPALGRTFLPGEDQLGKDRVVLLSHVLWESRFGSDPAMLGRDILLNGEAHTVIGVLQKGGPFDRAAAQIWKPLAFQPSNMTRDFRWLGASAKLKPGVTLEQARAEMDVIGQRIANAYPDSNKGWGVAVDRLADVLIGPAVAHRRHGPVRRHAVRVADRLRQPGESRAGPQHFTGKRDGGARRARCKPLALGTAVADRERRDLSVRWHRRESALVTRCMKWIQSLIPPSTLPPAVDIRMDTSVLLFTLTVAVVTGLLFGVAPAAQTTNPSLVSALKEGGHGTTAGSPGRRMRGGLVVAEDRARIRAAGRVGTADAQFLQAARHRSRIRCDECPDGRSADQSGTAPRSCRTERLSRLDQAAVEAVPGVRETAMTSALPLQGWGYGVPYSIADRELMDRANRRPAFFKIVSPSYFDALGIKLLAGRVLSDNDTAGAPPVALINETLAKREFPGEDPIGRRILVREIVPGKTELGQEIAWEIVGVIAGEKINGLGDEISAGMYVSNQQSPTYGINLIVRAGMPPQSLQRAVRSAVDSVNRDQALSDVRTLEQIVDQSMLGQPRHEHAPHGFCLHCAVAGCRGHLRRDFLHGRAADARDGHSRGTWSQRGQPAHVDIPGRDAARR